MQAVPQHTATHVRSSSAPPGGSLLPLLHKGSLGRDDIEFGTGAFSPPHTSSHKNFIVLLHNPSLSNNERGGEKETLNIFSISKILKDVCKSVENYLIPL